MLPKNPCPSSGTFPFAPDKHPKLLRRFNVETSHEHRGGSSCRACRCRPVVCRTSQLSLLSQPSATLSGCTVGALPYCHELHLGRH